ncbi:unnamed protein product [Leptidea sinapis]|uniref:Pentatricopeptide repeat-containing protein 2 n=1 Tax=Leptidea sinapis TaxID=189913 RepID=A0A5E4QGE4_9NEOP|nr:unnamed protein product [Leptidea sinapis]
MNKISYLIKSISRIYPNCNNIGYIPSRSIQLTKVQNLYTPSAIGIDGYLHTRRRIKEQFANFSDKFRSKMEDFVKDPKQMIFTEDLKNMVHMAEPTDIQLVLDMVKKFNTQKTEFRFGSFVFGPVVMRMFYFLEAPNEALQCFKDPDNKGFFDQLVSYQILLDLLYNQERYDDMYEIFEVVKERQINMTKYPKYPVILILAACYKQNTSSSYEYAKKLWTEMADAGSSPLRRACTFMAGLALKQGDPKVALETVALHSPHYITIRNIRTLPILKNVIDIDIDTLRSAVVELNNKDIEKEFETIVKALPRMPYKQRPFRKTMS